MKKCETEDKRLRRSQAIIFQETREDRNAEELLREVIMDLFVFNNLRKANRFLTAVLRTVFIILSCICLFSSPSFAEDDAIGFINRHLEQSYLTAGAGINMGGEGRWNDQIFEAEINNHLQWWHNSSVLGIESLDGLMMLNPKIQLRMYNEESVPVKTPGFLPRLTYYLWRDEDYHSNKLTRYNSIMLSHHSNGQAGEFYKTDGEVNTDSGNFSTNFLEIAHYETSDIPYLPDWSKVGLVWHPGFNREDNLDDQYETLKISLGAQKEAKALLNGDSRYYFSGTLSYILAGREYIVAPNKAYPSVRPERAEWTDNISFNMEMRIKPSSWDRISCFLKYDYGFDYYNIQFQERINKVQIGFSGVY